MTLEEFRASSQQDTAPESLGAPLEALWYDAKGDWERAHTLAQEANSPEGDWVHAYLHRKEGDTDNARYWYTRAGREAANVSLEHEWADIATALLG